MIALLEEFAVEGYRVMNNVMSQKKVKKNILNKWVLFVTVCVL